MNSVVDPARGFMETVSVFSRRGTGKEELDRMIDMLDEKEVEIAIDYLSNLLLSRAPKIRSHVQPRS